MPSNLAINDDLLEEARRVGKHRTKRETVEAALREYVLRRRRKQVLEIFGTIDFDDSWDYKRERERRR
jgi:Arc/MetJ family transcription regulator